MANFNYKKWVTDYKTNKKSLFEQITSGSNTGNVVLGYECPEVMPFFNPNPNQLTTGVDPLNYCINSSSPQYSQWVNACCSNEGNIPLGYTCPEVLPVFNPNPDQYPLNYCTNATSFMGYGSFVNACCGEESTSNTSYTLPGKKPMNRSLRKTPKLKNKSAQRLKEIIKNKINKLK